MGFMQEFNGEEGKPIYVAVDGEVSLGYDRIVLCLLVSVLRGVYLAICRSST